MALCDSVSKYIHVIRLVFELFEKSYLFISTKKLKANLKFSNKNIKMSVKHIIQKITDVSILLQ